MGFAVERDEPIGDAVRRIHVEQIDRAIAHLTSEDEPPEERIHNARKRFKEIRALLRMIAPSLGGRFGVENHFFRDAARELASTRDADAVIETVARLRKLSALPELRRLERALRVRRKESGGADLTPQIARIAAQLLAAKERVLDWPSLPDRFRTIGAGLETVIGEGEEAFARAAGEPTAENDHEWRKRVKDQWYHLQLLRHVWPPMMKAWEGVLEQLSDALGEHHDLDVLRALVPEVAKEIDRAPLLEIIDARLTELEQIANDLGTRIYCETPGAQRKRMRAWWKAWRGGVKS